MRVSGQSSRPADCRLLCMYEERGGKGEDGDVRHWEMLRETQGQVKSGKGKVPQDVLMAEKRGLPGTGTGTFHPSQQSLPLQCLSSSGLSESLSHPRTGGERREGPSSFGGG